MYRGTGGARRNYNSHAPACVIINSYSVRPYRGSTQNNLFWNIPPCLVIRSRLKMWRCSYIENGMGGDRARSIRRQVDGPRIVFRENREIPPCLEIRLGLEIWGRSHQKLGIYCDRASTTRKQIDRPPTVCRVDKNERKRAILIFDRIADVDSLL